MTQTFVEKPSKQLAMACHSEHCPQEEQQNSNMMQHRWTCFGFLHNLHELSPKFNRCKMGGNQSPGGKLSQRMSESMRLIKSRRMTVDSNSSQHIDLHRYSQSSWQLVYSWKISPWCRNSFIIWWLNLAGANGSEFLVVQVLCSGRRFFAKVN